MFVHIESQYQWLPRTLSPCRLFSKSVTIWPPNLAIETSLLWTSHSLFLLWEKEWVRAAILPGTPRRDWSTKISLWTHDQWESLLSLFGLEAQPALNPTLRTSSATSEEGIEEVWRSLSFKGGSGFDLDIWSLGHICESHWRHQLKGLSQLGVAWLAVGTSALWVNTRRNGYLRPSSSCQLSSTRR